MLVQWLILIVLVVPLLVFGYLLLSIDAEAEHSRLAVTKLLSEIKQELEKR